MKIGPPMWISADFVCMHLPVESTIDDDSLKKLFINKRVAKGCNIVQNQYYKNLYIEKDGCNE